MRTRWSFLTVLCLFRLISCIDPEFVHDYETGEIQFSLHGPHLNCVETLFESHKDFKQFHPQDFDIQDHSVDNRCKLSLRHKFLFTSLDKVTVKVEQEANILAKITDTFAQNSAYSPQFELKLHSRDKKEQPVDANARFIDALPYEFIRVIERREMFLCDTKVSFDQFGTYYEFLKTLRKFGCPLVYLNRITNEEPSTDSTPISEILSSAEYYVERCVDVSFMDSTGNVFLIRSLLANSSMDLLEYLRVLVFTEFEHLNIDMDSVDISWSCLACTSAQIVFPACSLNVDLFNHSQQITTFTVSPFVQLDELQRKVNELTVPWSVKSLTHHEVQLSSLGFQRAIVRHRTLAEQLNIVHRGYLSSEYVGSCLWQFLKQIHSGPSITLHATFDVPFLIEHASTTQFYNSSNTINETRVHFQQQFSNPNLRIFPVHDSASIWLLFPNIYVVREVETISSLQYRKSALLPVFLKNEVPFWKVISSYLGRISAHLEAQQVFPPKQFGYSLHSMEPKILSDIVGKLLNSTSICLLEESSDFRPSFCQKHPDSIFCQNVVLFENSLHSLFLPTIYVTWGYAPEEVSIADDPLASAYLENGKFSLFQFQEPDLDTKVFMGVFAFPSPARRINYRYEIKSWDPTQFYDPDFSNIQWLIRLLGRNIPSSLYWYIPFQRAQQLIKWIGIGIFEIIQQTVGKLEYEVITDYIIKPYLFSYIDYLKSIDQNASLLIGIGERLNIPFVKWSWIVRISPFIAKYIEYPLVQTTLNELLNAIENLKNIPIILFKKLVVGFVSRNQKELFIYDPITFDNRLVPIGKGKDENEGGVFSDISTVKNFNWPTFFKTLQSFGISKYALLKSRLFSLQSVHQYLFVSSRPVKIDYSERLDSVLVCKFVQRFGIEPKSMTLFERFLVNVLKRVFESLEVGKYTIKYAERLAALYLSKLLSQRSNRLFEKREKELSTQIEPVEKQFGKLKKYLNVVSEMKKILRL